MRKKFSMVAAILFVALVMAACGNKDEVTNPPLNNGTDTENSDANQDNTTNDNNAGNENNTGSENNTANTANESPYVFTSFNFDVDVDGKHDAVDVEYEEDTDGTEASYHDKIQGIQLNGNEAMQELDRIFSSMDFDENTPDEEVINAVYEAFNLPEDAQQFELDIDFKNGTEKEYVR